MKNLYYICSDYKLYVAKVYKIFQIHSGSKEQRLKNIRRNLVRGDKKLIAERAGVHWVWVSEVIRGRGTSERVLAIAEQIIAERTKRK